VCDDRQLGILSEKFLLETAVQNSRDESLLDPKDWEAFRASAHAALDDAIDYVRTVRERPVWQPVPPGIREALNEPLPLSGRSLPDVYADFKDRILPYATGNIHPRFFGWVHGAGLAGGLISEMLAAAMNSNCGGRNHGAIHVENAVISWFKDLFGFPAEASGLLVSGTSMANLVGLAVARNSRAGGDVRHGGLKTYPRALVAYASAEAHDSVVKAMEVLGLGSASLRKISVHPNFAIDVDLLRRSIADDREAGLEPFCVIGCAGTVNTGAIDPLRELASLCDDERLWFHVDGAFGALAFASDSLRPRFAGLERADSLGFDFHKWPQVQYDAGCILVRRGDLHRAAFSMHPPYLHHVDRGLGSGEDWPCDYGPELSRGFRALKIWFALREHGMRKITAVVERNCEQARYLAERISMNCAFELSTPVTLNIVCFRFRAPGMDDSELDALNENIVADVQESGIAAPSTTRVRGRLAIRVNITNHRTMLPDLDILLDAVLAAGRARAGGRAARL
jgi:aromatic-L-amino-acid/L-tryptophan decarboxylase